MELSGSERERFQEALLSAFYSDDLLEQMVLHKCNRSLGEFTSGPRRSRVFQLITAAEAEGWTLRLIEGARAANPGNPKLLQFHQWYQASIQRSISGAELERITSLAKGYIDPAVLREKLEEIELRVCRLEHRNGDPIATGFLISRSVVLTNFHAIERKDLTALNVRFDHKVVPGQKDPLNPGKIYQVTRCIAQSPYSLIDGQYPKSGVPKPEELDYALLQVDGSPGDEVVGGKPRGWFELPSQHRALEAGSLLFVIQHPQGRPMKVAIDSFIEFNANRTRLTYRTNTETGSSGSPCFDEAWNLVALHHSGDPREHMPAEFNQGIPAATIRESLSQDVRRILGWS